QLRCSRTLLRARGQAKEKCFVLRRRVKAFAFRCLKGIAHRVRSYTLREGGSSFLWRANAAKQEHRD
ncbi:MAG: hypothetical protein ABI767_10360, partial [Rhodanobacter sp.]